MLNLNNEQKKQVLKTAKGIADWYVNNQFPRLEHEPRAGALPFAIYSYGNTVFGTNWSMAFAMMGLMSASEVFEDKVYKKSALSVAEYLKTLQIFDPFNKKHYGSIRELTPQTPWCYTRDALSTAWSFIDLYRFTNDSEYLTRAELWGEWYLKEGRDEDDWNWWAVEFGPAFETTTSDIRNDMQGSFQGGSLNYIYHMYKETKNEKWAKALTKMADYLITYIQQDNGLFASIERITRKPPKDDPIHGLHRTNDDLATLGLLCTYEITKNTKYIDAIKKYLNAIFDGQKENGSFDTTIASIPVVLNVIFEMDKLNISSGIPEEKQQKALNKLLNSQSTGSFNAQMRGALYEWPDLDIKDVCTRSSAYALIYLLKLYSNKSTFLSIC